MDWLTKIFSGGAGNIVNSIGDTVDKFVLTGEEKEKFKLQMEELLQKRDSEVEQTIRSELGAKERVLVAELSQGDNYTKRARPTVVYMGLVFIFLQTILLPFIKGIAGWEFVIPELPTGFWAGWSGIVGTWAIGRSFEKVGIQNNFTRTITGSLPVSRLLK
ncbi:MAG: holin family protein [Spirochaetia bacterium]|nr:holin family protein [Spirochaetia bacterium]